MRDVPIPARMAKLPRDERGYPIFVMAYRDQQGRAHFTVNDEAIRRRLVRSDQCSICGGRLLRGRWFVGGARSAFDPHGAYIDPPMHLAAPKYAGLIGGRTIAADDSITLVDQQAIMSPSTANDVRPDYFVAVLARGQRNELMPTGYAISPTRPYITVEYWRHGCRISEPKEQSGLLRSGAR
jgi:hypothetical protein